MAKKKGVKRKREKNIIRQNADSFSNSPGEFQSHGKPSGFASDGDDSGWVESCDDHVCHAFHVSVNENVDEVDLFLFGGLLFLFPSPFLDYDHVPCRDLLSLSAPCAFLFHLQLLARRNVDDAFPLLLPKIINTLSINIFQSYRYCNGLEINLKFGQFFSNFNKAQV